MPSINDHVPLHSQPTHPVLGQAGTVVVLRLAPTTRFAGSPLACRNDATPIHYAPPQLLQLPALLKPMEASYWRAGTVRRGKVQLVGPKQQCICSSGQ